MDELKGVGHFSFWFVFGYVAFRVLLAVKKDPLWVKMYGPFIPFTLGTFAVIPYLLTTLGVASQDEIMAGVYNIFLFYGLLNQVSLIVHLFSGFHLAVIWVAFAYVALIFHYIQLVKLTRVMYAK